MPQRRQQRDEAAAAAVRVDDCYLASICVETQQRVGAAAALQQLQWRTKRKREIETVGLYRLSRRINKWIGVDE